MLDALLALFYLAWLWRIVIPTVAFAVLAFFAIGESYVWVGVAVGVPIGLIWAISAGDRKVGDDS